MSSPSFDQSVSNLSNRVSVGGGPSSRFAINNSFSGCDIRATVKSTDPLTNNTSMKLLGNIATLSYSIHREKFPVRTLGTTFPKAFTRGPRTIAGTLIFNVFDRYALWDILETKKSLDRGFNEDAHALVGDQIAPFDITCTFISELGIVSRLMIYDVELVDEGQVMSVNDIYIESTHSFVAADISVMSPSNTENPSTQNITLPNTVFQFDSGLNTVTNTSQIITGPNPLSSAQ